MKPPKVFFIIVLLAAGQASAHYTWTNLAGDSHHPVEDSGRQNRSGPGFPVCAAAAGHTLFRKGEWDNQHLGSGEGTKAAVAHTGGSEKLLLE